MWKKAGDLVYPARYIQLPPQFMVWETKAGHPDRLLLVEDGMSADGVPFPPHQYIVALNNNGPDHPLYNATFYSLVNWFVAFKFGLGWFMEYAQKYGMPKQVIRYANEKDRQQIVDDLSDETVLNTVLIKEGQGTGFEMQYPTGGAASLPQAVLVQKAEEACHKAILGQTLTSDTSASGGSLAQAKVHAGVQAEVVMKLAEAVADILNQQLIPAIIQANYGRVQGLPIPELRCKLPQAVASIERAQFLKTALEVPGMKVLKSEAYEYLNLTQPGEDDEVFEAQAPNEQGGPGGIFGGGFPGMEGGSEELPDADAKDEVVMSSRGVKKNDPAVAWLAPLRKKLEEARSSGVGLSELREQIRAWKPDRRALADAMARNIVAGFERGAAAAQEAIKGNTAEEEIAAENPYGCNQHGHGWVDPCPYGGDGSNGMAGKSALQIAGGAENVNPEPDEDEKKKKAEAEAEAEQKAKEEAERKAREEEERKKKEFDDETEALKKEIHGDAIQKLQPYKDELQAIIDKYKGQKLSAQQKTALAYLEKLKGGLDEKLLERLTWQDWEIEHRAQLSTGFNKDELKSRAGYYIKKVLEKAAAEANKRIAKLEGTRKPVVGKGVIDKEVATNKRVMKAEARMQQVGTDMEKAVRMMSARGVNIAQEEMHKAASELVAAIRKVKGDEQYFADNNDPAKVLPAGLTKKIAANPSRLKTSKQKQFAKFISQFEPIMEINEDALGEILKERGGRFVNCFEKPGVCSGSNPDYIDAREAAENKLFGTEKGMISTKRPVYAYLRRNIEETIRRSHGYGDLCVTFKPVVRNRCTMTGGDSLNYYDSDLASCALLIAPEKGNCLRDWQIEEINDGGSFDSMESRSLYMEAQIFGDLTANDIKSIGIPTYKRDALETANYYANMLKKYNKSVKVTKKYNHYLVEVE